MVQKLLYNDFEGIHQTRGWDANAMKSIEAGVENILDAMPSTARIQTLWQQCPTPYYLFGGSLAK